VLAGSRVDAMATTVTPETDNELVARAASGDQHALGELYRRHRGLIYRFANIYARSMGLDVHDLAQEGFFGIVDGVRKFDSTRGTTFISYASDWIRSRIQRAAYAAWGHGTKPLNSKAARVVFQSGNRAALFTGLPEGDEQDAVVAARLSLTKEELRAGRQFVRAKHVSLDALDSPVQHIAAHDSPSEDELVERIDAAARKAALQGALARLNPQEREVLLRRASGATLREIGAAYAVSRERIRQIEVEARDYIRRRLKRQGVLRAEAID